MTTGLGPTDIFALFSSAFGEIATVRASRGLPAIITHIGSEYLPQEDDAPRIVIVPERNKYAPARAAGNQTGMVGDFNPKPLYRRLMQFAAHCWGDDKPASTEQDLVYSLNSTVELEREFLVALAHNFGGPAAIVSADISGEWDQPTNMQRRGRLLIIRFAIETPVTQEPFITLPFSTASTSGVQVSATVAEVFPDGSSSVAGIIVTPP